MTPSPIAPTPPHATEDQLIGLWLHGKSPNTIRAYFRRATHSQYLAMISVAYA